MALNLAENALISTFQVPDYTHKAENPAENPGIIPVSKTITGLELRLSRVFIKDNHTAHIGPFPGRADLYLLVIVADDRSATPRTLTLNGFPHANDQEDLLVDRTIYFWQPAEADQVAPTQMHVLVSVIKSKQRLRDTAAIIAQAQASTPYQDLLTQLGGALHAAASPATELLLQLGSLVVSHLTSAEDKTLFTQVTSFTNLNGDFDTLGKTAHSQENRYVATTLTLIVRDAARALAEMPPAETPTPA